MEKLTYTWTVKFSIQGNDSKILQYPRNFASALKWSLTVNLNPIDEDSKDYVSIFLSLVNSNEPWVKATFNFSIYNNKNDKVKSLKSKQLCKFLVGKVWGFKKFIKKDFLLDESNGLITDGEFEILCDVTMYTSNFPWWLSVQLDDTFDVPESRLLDDLWLMYQNQKFCDVSLIVQDTEFKAHKAVLAAQSPVFSAMLEHEMEESKLNQVKIPDINPEVFKEMMYFVYTGKSPKMETMAVDLLAAADKYQLQNLKIMCGEAISQTLVINNAAEILLLADCRNVSQLKTYVIDFIISYPIQVMETDGFKSIMTLHPHLFAEIFRTLAVKTSMDEYEDPISPTVEVELMEA